MSAHEDLLYWLTTHGLEKYYQTLFDNDINTIPLASSLTPAELKELGFSLGDRKRYEMATRPGRSYTDFERTVLEKYPYVIAYPFRRMLDEDDGRNRLELLSYTLLNTLKLTALVMTSDYFRSSFRSSRLNQLFRASLFQPSMGHWNAFIREASAIVKAEGMSWTFPELAAAYEALETSPKAQKYPTETEYTDEDGLLKYRASKLTAIGTLINFRNRYLGHGMPLEKAQYTMLFQTHYPVLTDLLQGFSCLSELFMVRNDHQGCYILQGDNVRITGTDLAIPRDDDMHLRDIKGRQIPLLPFYIVPGKYNAGEDGRSRVLVYEQNTSQRLIFYSPESVKAEVSGDVLDRLRLTLEEKEREMPFSPDGFTGQQLMDRLETHNADVIDGLQKEVKVIEGIYQHRFDAELALMGWAGSAAGLFLLAAEAGSGKTNLLVHLVKRYGARGYPTLLLRGNRLTRPTLELALRHVLNLQAETPLQSYKGLIGTQERPLLLLVDGGNECPEPIRLLQSAIELAEAFPGGGLKIVLSWRVNDISQMPTAVFRNTEVLFPAANRLHPNLLAANAYLLQPMSLMETEGAWKSFAAHSSRRFRPRFDFQELQLADRPLAMELSNPLLLRLCMELFHDKALKGKSTGFTNLWRQWWERLRQQPQEAAYLQQLARFLATKGRGQCTLDELFDNADISSAVNNLQVDSPHRQLIRKGVVSQYFQDGFLQVGFTMEAAFHYILSLELTGENLAEHLAGSVFWEAPTRYCLWEGVHDPDDGLLFQLIDDASFPNHLTAFALAQYTVLHGPGKALERLLQMPTPQDWEALTLAARQLRESRPKEHRALADAILDQVLTGGLTASPDALAPLLPDAGKLLADGVFAARVQGQPLRTAEGLQALAAYHSTYGRNREALGCLQVAIELSADIGVKLSVHLLMADQYNQLGLYAAGLSEIAKAKELLGRGVVSDAVLEADIGFSESKLYRSNSFYPRALETLRIAREAYGKKLGTFHAKTLLADDQICRTLLSLGQYTEASDLAERCANDAGRSLGTQNTIYSDFVQLQGDLFKEKGKHDEALDRYKEALTIELSCFGDSHPCIAESYSRIGSIWEIKGNYDKALGYFEQTLSINLEYYGKSHPNVAVSYNQIGSIWETKGNYEKALEYFQKNLEINLQYYGESHPNVAESNNRIGDIWETKGDYDKALGYFEKDLEINLQYYGESHPNVAVSYYRIGGIWKTKGDYDKALEYFEKDLKISIQYYGESHPNLAASYNQIGGIWNTKGDFEKAIGYFDKALEINLQYYGESHPKVAVSYNRIGDIWETKGDYDKALGYFEKNLEINLQYYGESHPKVAVSYYRIGGIWQIKGEYDKALGYFEKDLEISLEYYGESHPNVAASYNQIGGVWETKGDYDKALGYFEKDLEITLQYYGESHPNVAVSYNRIGGIWETKGDYDKALGYFEKNLEINLRYYGESHPNVTVTYNIFGLLYMKLNMFHEALESFKTALHIEQSFQLATHPNIGSIKKNIAHAMIELQQFADAEKLLSESIEVLIHSGIPHDPRLGKAYQYRAMLYRYQERWTEAEAAIEAAIAIFLEENGESHINTADALLEKARIMQAAGNRSESAHWLTKCHAIRLERLGPEHPDTMDVSRSILP